MCDGKSFSSTVVRPHGDAFRLKLMRTRAGAVTAEHPAAREAGQCGDEGPGTSWVQVPAPLFTAPHSLRPTKSSTSPAVTRDKSHLPAVLNTAYKALTKCE